MAIEFASGMSAYNDTQYDHNYPDGIDHHYWNVARNRILHHFLSARGITPVTPLLEIGCGKGIVVRFLRELGWAVHGVELAPVNALPEAAPFVTTGTDFALLPEEHRNQYTTILLLDVIEHIDDPVAFLKRIPDAFTNVTQIILTVPARRELWTNYDDYFGHFRRYDKAMLHELSQQTGLPLTSARYFFRTLYPAMLAVSKFGQQRTVAVKAPAAGRERRLHAWLGKLLYAESAWLPDLFPGASLFATLEVPITRQTDSSF